MKIQKGFTLIEVLISLGLLSVLLLGIAQLQLVALGINQKSWNLTIATLQAENMSAVIQSDVNWSGYLDKWQKDTQELLPGSKNGVTSKGNDEYIVSISAPQGEYNIQMIVVSLS